jgi:hypothetical protein
VVLICGDLGSVYEIQGKACGRHIGQFEDDASLCVRCAASPYLTFRDATSDEILALGFQVGDYT